MGFVSVGLGHDNRIFRRKFILYIERERGSVVIKGYCVAICDNGTLGIQKLRWL